MTRWLSEAAAAEHIARMERLRAQGTVRTHKLPETPVKPLPEPPKRPAKRKPPRPTASYSLLVQIELLGLPKPVLEYKFHEKRKWRADMAWPDPKYRVLVEVDGAVFSNGRHTRGTGYTRDCEKCNAATEMGFRVFRFTSQQAVSGYACNLLGRVLNAA